VIVPHPNSSSNLYSTSIIHVSADHKNDRPSTRSLSGTLVRVDVRCDRTSRGSFLVPDRAFSSNSNAETEPSLVLEREDRRFS